MSITGIEAAFIGTVGRDPELRTSKAGKPWLALSVAVGDGDATQWVKVTAFNTKAQELAGTLTKGMRLYIEGRDHRIDRWTGNDGKERAELKCVAARVERLGEIGRNKPAKAKAPAEGDQAAPPAPTAAPVTSAADWQRPLVDDTIPFAPEL